ncbi:neutral zinc metallopeptidase [Amycolatopsis mongoliensis]|uniref:Neutral zinc metallopeptidase n=1 Tax=Amycolatopsis mongoliensis TaxID=715475 RepID=A0A9Y2NMG3_9PSEU|nr:neutral zinc metallopeptidase [Amycolatopsis sp. 4-36]WIY03330.1 neutral zinc metallopeptidase [Amycolatopsis sp. 4-36]
MPPPGVRPLPQGRPGQGPGGQPGQGPGPGGAPNQGPGGQAPHGRPNPAPGQPSQGPGGWPPQAGRPPQFPGGPPRGPQGTQGFPTHGPPSGPYPRPGSGAPLPPPAAAAPPTFSPAYAGPPPGAPFGPRFAPGYRPYVAKKSNTGVIVAVAIIGIVAVVGGLVAAVALIGGNTRHVADAGYSSTYPSDTYETTSADETTETTSSTEETATSETTERTTRTSETPRGPRSVVATGTNPMFASADYGLQNVPCSLSRWATDQNSATRFFQSGIACLDAMWSRMLGAVNLPFRSPNLSVPQSLSESSTPCGGGGTTTGVTPFYCPSNDTIYMPMDRIEIDVWGNHPGPYLSILAHEYGHHVQNLAGITEAYGNQRYDAGADSAVGLELSRRMELEAQCFSGMFLGSASVSGGSVDKNIYNEAWNAQDRGDDYARNGKRDHGSAKHNISWWQHGATKNRNQQCNTWLSASGDVS